MLVGILLLNQTIQRNAGCVFGQSSYFHMERKWDFAASEQQL